MPPGGGGGGGGMSMEAKIGVGVAVPVVVLAVAGLSLFIWLRRRSRKRAAVDAAALAWQRRQQQEEEDRQTQGTEKTASQAAHISRKPVARTESLSVSATPTSSKGHELSGDDRSRFAELSNENTGPIRHEVDGQMFKKYEMQGSMHHGEQRHTNSPSELPGGS